MKNLFFKHIKKNLVQALSFLALTLIISCTTGGGSLPSSSGKTGQLVVVIENEYWKGAIGDSIRAVFGREIEVLPQSESEFEINQLTPSYFTEMFKIHRNLLIVEIKNGPPKIETRRDVWASQQIVTSINAPDVKSFNELFEPNKEKLLNIYLQNDRERLQKAYQGTEDKKLGEELIKKFGLQMTFPTGYRMISSDSNFAWIRYETNELNQSFLIYRYDYKDTSDFSLKNIIAVRDSFVKKYVPGPLPNTYMTTETLVTPTRKELKFKNLYAVEVRGLWKVVNDFMGGPFVGLNIVNPNDKRMYRVEGFIYAPKLDKRLYLRQVEAILYSLNFIGNKNV